MREVNKKGLKGTYIHQASHILIKDVKQWCADVMLWPDEKLLELALGRTKRGTPSVLNYAAGCLKQHPRSAVRRQKVFFIPIHNKLMELGYYDPKYSFYANEKRRLVLRYLKTCDVKVFSNLTPTEIRMKVKKDIGMKRLASADERQLCNRTINEFCDDLRDKGFIRDTTSMSKKRTIRTQVEISAIADAKTKLFSDLSNTPINNESDILQGSELEPYLEFKHVFAFGTINTCYGRVEFETYIEPYLDYLSGGKPCKLEDVIYTYALTRFKKYQKENIETKKFSTRAANAAIHAFRLLVNIYSSISEGVNVIDVIGFKNARSTEQRTPFPKSQRTQIYRIISDRYNEIKSRSLFLTPSKLTNINPVFEPAIAEIRNNMGGCFALRLKSQSNEFSKYCSQATIRKDHYDGYISEFKEDLFTKLNVLPEIDRDTVYFLMLKLAAVTGLNHEAIVDLQIGDFEPNHPATGKPCLRYWKKRSTGEKRLHLDFIDAEIQWMTMKQGEEVSDIINTTIKLTAPLRSYASDAISSNLFIYRKMRKLDVIEVNSFRCNRSAGLRSAKKIVRDNKLLDDEGQPLLFNISKFRTTLVSEYVENGTSIREIQLLLGHRNIKTTIEYLDRMDFDSFAKKKVNEALIKIHEKSLNFKVSKANKGQSESNTIHISTDLATCTNIFNPPNFIKSLPTYVPGKPCSLYNKCLSCDNCLITKDHLPKLFAQQREFSILLHNTHVMNTPYHNVIEENLALLEEVLGQNSEFDKEALTEAELLSQQIELSNGASL